MLRRPASLEGSFAIQTRSPNTEHRARGPRLCPVTHGCSLGFYEGRQAIVFPKWSLILGLENSGILFQIHIAQKYLLAQVCLTSFPFTKRTWSSVCSDEGSYTISPLACSPWWASVMVLRSRRHAVMRARWRGRDGMGWGGGRRGEGPTQRQDFLPGQTERPVRPLPSLAPPHLPPALLLRWRRDGEGALRCPAPPGRGQSRRTRGFTLQLEKPLPHMPAFGSGCPRSGGTGWGAAEGEQGTAGLACLQNDERCHFIPKSFSGRVPDMAWALHGPCVQPPGPQMAGSGDPAGEPRLRRCSSGAWLWVERGGG